MKDSKLRIPKDLNVYIFFLLFTCLSSVTNAIWIKEPQHLYSDKEIVWFGTCANHLITYWADSTVVYSKLIDNSFVSCFKALKYSHKSTEVFASPGECALLAVLDKAAIDINDKIAGCLYFYDLSSGEIRNTVSVSGLGRVWGNGFDKDGKFFFYHLGSPETVCCIQVADGKELWHYSYEADVLIGKQILSESKWADFYINGFVVRDKNGQILLKRKMMISEGFLQPIYIHSSNIVGYFYADMDRKIMALDLTDGRKLWERFDTNLSSMIAATLDGSKQAFHENGVLTITNLPETKSVEVVGIPEICDAVFIEDGTKLICLPRLRKVDENKKNNTITYARHSHVLSVVDTSNGKIVTQYLPKQTDKLATN